MRKPAICMLLCSMICVSTAASAAGQMKPGLWDMTVKSDAMKDIKMPKLSAEQMAQMKKMGIQMPNMQDGGMTVKVCMSKAMVERDEGLAGPKEQGCESRNFKRTGDSYSVDVMCDGPNLKGEGKAKGTFAGGEKFNSVYDFKGTAQGKPVLMHHETSGKWLSADCGKVRPHDRPGK